MLTQSQYTSGQMEAASRLPGFSALECAELQAFVREKIPLTAAMNLQVGQRNRDTLPRSALYMHAPLEANINDKGSAFGGAIASLLTLAGWGWLWLANRQLDYDLDVVIAGSQMEYLLPVREMLCAVCLQPALSDWQKYVARLIKGRRAAMVMQCELRLADGSLAARMNGKYASVPKT